MTAEKKERKPRESSPWRIYWLGVEIEDEGDRVTPLIPETCSDRRSYASLRDAEKECARLAACDIGRVFVPVKCGTSFKAEEVRTVEVRKS